MAEPEFFQVRARGKRYQIHFGTVKKHHAVLSGRTFATIVQAKHAAHELLACAPLTVYTDEVPYDPTNALHRTLRAIEEDAHPSSAVVGVGSTHYLISKGRLNKDVRIKYKVGKKAAIAYARNDARAIGEV